MLHLVNNCYKLNRVTVLLSILLIGLSTFCWSQNDTIRLRNNDVLVGEVKSLTTGVLVMETSYSDDDFNIDFSEVVGLELERNFIIRTSQGVRLFGKMKTKRPGEVVVSDENGVLHLLSIINIIGLDAVEGSFWSRFSGGFDIGFNFTKAKNNSQLTMGSAFYHDSELWKFAFTMDLLRSLQDDADRIIRDDINLELRRVLKKEWYVISDISYLANTEQSIESRYSPSLGIGKYLITTNKLYLGLTAGFTYNIENYVDDSLDKESSEVFVTLQYNMFDFKNIDINTGLSLHPSLSESKRYRIDYDLKFKIDLPYDFYIKLGFTLNYDNQPAVLGADTDYVFTSGIGWEID